MHETLEYPTIDADKAPVVATSAAVAVISIKEATLARFTATETALRALADRYSRVAFNVTTPKGLAEAKAARNELREHGRYAVQRVEKAIKDDVNDLKRVMAVEAERLIAIVKPVEDAVDAQIKVREEQIAAEKAERERIEAERKNKHLTNLATLRGYVAQGKGKTSEQLGKAAAAVSAIELDPAAWEEFHAQAVTVRLEVHEELSRMAAEALAREREREEAERLRVENARLAAEMAAERERLAQAAAQVRADAEALQRRINEQAEREAQTARIAAEFQAAQEQERAELLAKRERDAALDLQRAAEIQAEFEANCKAKLAASAGVSAEEKAAVLAVAFAEPEPAGDVFETLAWHDAATRKPDSYATVLCWGSEGFFCGYLDPDTSGGWIGCESGGSVVGVTHWAQPAGPQNSTTTKETTC